MSAPAAAAVRCRPTIRGTLGTVASTDWLATAAGMAMFDRGGNAFDAAAAAGFALQVVEPHLNGPAGDVPILLHAAGTGKVSVICGQGPMPAAASLECFRGLGLRHIPGSGLLPACVPGAFGAWLRLLAEYGTLPLDDVLEYAIGYAEDGYPILPSAAQTIEVFAPLFRQEWTESARTYLPGGAPPAAHARFRNPVLAETYRRILREARAAGADREARIEAAHDAFYRGFVAEAIDAFAAREMLDGTGERHAGLLTGQDLARWRPTVEHAVSVSFRGYQVHKPGPWSQGPVFLQQLALLDGFELAAMDPSGADYIHTVVECAKLAYADREAWYGDPLFTDVPLNVLLSEQYAKERRALVGSHAVGELRPGLPGGRQSWIPETEEPAPPSTGAYWRRQLATGLPNLVKLTESRGDTCCVTAVDRAGNLVAATPSGGWLKSSSVVPGLGFPLGTRGQMAWLEEGHPNSLAPGKRPRTTLSPTLVLRDGEPCLAFGTPGGDQQDQWTLEFFLAHTQFGRDLQAATETLAFHTDHIPPSFTPRVRRPRTVLLEQDSSQEALRTAAELERRGHEVEPVPALSLGKVCATGLDADGVVLAAASPRGEQAYAMGR